MPLVITSHADCVLGHLTCFDQEDNSKHDTSKNSKTCLFWQELASSGTCLFLLLLVNCSYHNIKNERHSAKSVPSPHRHLGHWKTCERDHPIPPSQAKSTQIRTPPNLLTGCEKYQYFLFKPLGLKVIFVTKQNLREKSNFRIRTLV